MYMSDECPLHPAKRTRFVSSRTFAKSGSLKLEIPVLFCLQKGVYWSVWLHIVQHFVCQHFFARFTDAFDCSVRHFCPFESSVFINIFWWIGLYHRTELDGRYSVQVFFSEFFHFEHLLCPRRLLLVVLTFNVYMYLFFIHIHICMHMCDMLYAYVIYKCDVLHTYFRICTPFWYATRYSSSIRATCLIHVRDMPSSLVWHVFICVTCSFIWRTCRIRICNTPYSHAPWLHGSFICVIRRIHSCK